MFRSGPLKGGLQEKMYFLLGCVRCASGKYDLIDRECDFQRKWFKNQILHDIFMENSKRYEKWGQDTAKVRKWIPGWAKVKERAPKVSQGTPKVSQKGAKGSQREPKVSQREPKVSQREPKVSQKDAKGSQKWAKGRPKCIKKSVFGKDRENDGKRVAALGIRRTILGATYHQKSMKKTMRKSMPKKSWISWKNDTEIRCFLDWNSSKNRLCAKSA